MLTLFRLASSRFSGLAVAILLFALGSFDTARAQTITLSSSTLQFTAAQGNDPNPDTQTVTTGSTGAAINFIISTNQTWLLASTGAFGGTGGTTGQTITVQINSLALTAGAYTGIITLTPTNGSAAVTIAVSLTITGSGPATTTLVASLTQLNFGYEVGHGAPPSQGVQISTTGINLPISSVGINYGPQSNCSSSWLQATPSATTTPATITVGISPTGLTAGECTAAIIVNSTSASNGTSSVSIGVTLYISTSPLLNLQIPEGLTSVTLQQGQAPQQFTITTSSTDPTNPVAFSATAASSNNWLAVAPLTGTTPSNLIVQITPGLILGAGHYSGSITVSSQGIFNGQITIPVSFTLTPATGVSVSPSGTQNFNEAQGSLPAAPIPLTLTGNISTTFTTSVSQCTGGLTWLSATPTNGSVTPSSPATVNLAVLSNSLTIGTYSCSVTINFQTSGVPAISIPVSLTVGPPAAALTVSPSSLSFSYQLGAATPAAQSVAVSNPAQATSGTAISYTVSAITQSWLSITPSTGSTPGTVSVSIAPQSLSPGTYTGAFTLSASGVPSTTVNVTVTVTQSVTPQILIIGNSASGVGGQLAPGEIITIKGSQLGPTTPQLFTQSTLSSPVLGGVEVTFSGYPGTLLYVSAGQINVTVPYEIAGMSTATVVVAYNNVQSAGITQNVASAALGLYTANSTGSGQASILNQNYTINGPASPAAEGSYISVYATGGGQTVPASTDAEVTPSTSLFPLALSPYVTATIGGKNAPVVFAGAAPGFVTGLVQFNIQVPTGVSGSALPIVVSINGATVIQSQSGATVSVQ